MDKEQDRIERLKQIKERQALSLPVVDRLDPEFAEAVRDIDYLLGLLESQ